MLMNVATSRYYALCESSSAQPGYECTEAITPGNSTWLLEKHDVKGVYVYSVYVYCPKHLIAMMSLDFFCLRKIRI